MTIVLSIALIGTFAVLWRAIPSDPHIEPAIFHRLFGEGRAVHALVVFMIVASAFYLAIESKLSAEVSTLLSGIAGFAFGSMRGGSRDRKESK